jgi:hypothetical protein
MEYPKQLFDVNPLSGNPGETAVTVRQRKIWLRDSTSKNAIVFRTSSTGETATVQLNALGVGPKSGDANLAVTKHYNEATKQTQPKIYFPFWDHIQAAGIPQWYYFGKITPVSDQPAIIINSQNNNYICGTFITNRKDWMIDFTSSNTAWDAGGEIDNTFIKNIQVSICQNLDLEYLTYADTDELNAFNTLNYKNWTQPQYLNGPTTGAQGWTYSSDDNNDIGKNGYYTVMFYAELNMNKTIEGTALRYMRVGDATSIPGGTVDVYHAIKFTNDTANAGNIDSDLESLSLQENVSKTLKVTSSVEPWTASVVAQ